MEHQIEQAVKLLRSLPEETQERAVEWLRDLVQDARNEERWSDLMKRGADLFAADRFTRQGVTPGSVPVPDSRRDSRLS